MCRQSDMAAASTCPQHPKVLQAAEGPAFVGRYKDWLVGGGGGGQDQGGGGVRVGGRGRRWRKSKGIVISGEY